MCRDASFVLTKDKCYWSLLTDSHEEIIKEFELHPDGTHGVNVLRVEITPPENNYEAPAKEWEYKVDQDILPKWADHKKDEKRARKALDEWMLARLIRTEVLELRNKKAILLNGGKILEVKDGAILSVWGGTISAVRGGTITAVCGGTISEVWGGTLVWYADKDLPPIKNDGAILVRRDGKITLHTAEGGK